MLLLFFFFFASVADSHDDTVASPCLPLHGFLRHTYLLYSAARCSSCFALLYLLSPLLFVVQIIMAKEAGGPKPRDMQAADANDEAP